MSVVSQLRSLNIAHCKNVNAEGLQLIADNFKNMEHFNITGISRTSKRLVVIDSILNTNKESLKSLELSTDDCNYNSTGLITQLCTMRKLTMLDISEIVLPSVSLVAEMLTHLSPTLEILRMSRCVVKSVASSQVKPGLNCSLNFHVITELSSFLCRGNNCEKV